MSALIFVRHLVWLGLAGLLLAEVFGAAGAGLVPWWRLSPRNALERFGVSFLAGLAVTGLSLFGLALAGLLYPGTIALLTASAAVPSLIAGHRPTLTWTALGETAKLGRTRCTLLVLAVIPFVFFLTTPFLNIDAVIYHMGAPAQFLRMHRILSENVPFPYLLPLPIEMTYAIPLAIGDHRLASIIIILARAATSALFLGREPGKTAWIGPLLLLACGGTLTLAIGGKNDIAASSFIAAGVLLWEGGMHGPGAALMGYGAAAKPVYGPFLVAWLLIMPFPRRRIGRIAAGLAVPFLPWFARSWLVTGNPVYPFAAGLFPTFEWGPDNETAFAAYLETLVLPPAMGLAGFLGHWLDHLRAESFAVVLLLPGMLLFHLIGRRKEIRAGPYTAGRPIQPPDGLKATAACLLASALILAVTRVPRYCLPSVLIISLLVARQAGSLFPFIPRAVPAALLSAFALARIWLDPGIGRPGWREAFMSFRNGAAREFTTQEDASRLLTELGARRYISVASKVTYPLPGRALHGGTMGETPILWKIAKESATPGGVAKRIRQLGATHLLYNHISAEWNSFRYGDSFLWDRRMFSVFKSWFKSHAVPAGLPTRCDFVHGGFYAYRLNYLTARRAVCEIIYLPGTESVYREGLRARDMNRFDESLPVFRRLVIEHPDVVTYRAELGFDCAMTGWWADAYRLLKPVADSGMRHVRAPIYGLAALREGHPEEARVFLRNCLPVYLFEPTMIRLGLARACLASARNSAGYMAIAGPGDRRVSLDAAGAALAEAESSLDFVPAPDEQDVPEMRREIRREIAETRRKFRLSN